MNPIKKGLTVIVVFLFIGIAFLPSINSEIPVKENYEINEECNCRQVSKSHIILLKSLIKRVRTNEKILSLLPIWDAEIEKKYKDLTDSLTPFLEIDETDTLGPFFDAFCERVYTFEERLWNFIFNIAVKIGFRLFLFIYFFLLMYILMPIFAVYIYAYIICFGLPFNPI